MPLSARLPRFLLAALLLALPTAPVAAAQWTDDVPARLAGTWTDQVPARLAGTWTDQVPARLAGTWTDQVPARLAGTWAEEGADCDDPDSRLLIFSDGGYRWRLSVTKWGLARGQYRYPNSQARRIEFRLRRFFQTSDAADYILILDGADLKKVNPSGRTTKVYRRCR
ncbi:hypothetical protein [Roseospirillum parvum]|nr:hypothetical protein [Roseospirillum parvum]